MNHLSNSIHRTGKATHSFPQANTHIFTTYYKNPTAYSSFVSAILVDYQRAYESGVIAILL
jgi:hypothetical protein